MKREYIWPTVVLVAVALAGVTGLILVGVDLATISAILGILVVPVLGAFGAAQLAAQREQINTVREQTNGNTSRLLDIVERQGRIISQLPALPPSIPPGDSPPHPSRVE